MLTDKKRITSAHMCEIQAQYNMYMHRDVDCLCAFIRRMTLRSQQIQRQDYIFSLA